MLHQGRKAVLFVPGHHQVPPGRAEAEVDVAGVALASVPFRHEREAHPLLVRYFLGARFVNAVVVAGRQGVGEPEGDLVLAEVALAFGRLDVQACAGHLVADTPQKVLDPARADDRVVDVVLVGWREVVIPTPPRFFVRVLEDDELELGPDVGDQAPLGEARDLPLQDLAGEGSTEVPSSHSRSHNTKAVPGFHGIKRSVDMSGRITKSP